MVRSRFLARLARLRERFDDGGQDGLLVSDPANVRYLTGFSGSFCRLVIGPVGVFLVTDRRYAESAPEEPPVYDLVVASGARYLEAEREAILLSGARRMGFEPGAISWWEVRALEACIPRRARLVAAGGQVEELRRIKDDLEIEAIRFAVAATERALAHVLDEAEPGMEERELAAILAADLRRHGEGPPAFEPLLATGPRTAIVHARPTSRRIEAGDLLLVDAGATVSGMAADMCRTIVVGADADLLQGRAFDIVREALDAAIAAIRPGDPARQVEDAARRVLEGYGYPLRHDTGHGVGLDVHESPRLARDSTDVLAPGMVLAIEPGLYVAGWGGVRLEELVLVTAEASCRLTRLKVSPTLTTG